jgi:hypothetical protein
VISEIKQLFFAALFFLTSCSSEVEKIQDQPVAQVGSEKLFVSEMQNELPHYSDTNDSIKSAHEYIDNWIVQQLMVSEAESKLSKEESDISQELEKYRQELLIYKYKNKRLQQLTDQTIPDKDILNYYKKNQDKFVLTQPVVKVNYIIFPASLTIPATIRDILPSNNAPDIEKCQDFIFKNAKKFDNYKNNWIHLDNLLKSMHVSLSDPDSFLKNHKIIERKVGNNIHLVAIKQYYLSGEQAPMELIAPQIKGAVINREKLDFLREIKDSLYKDALKYNKFKVFNQ